MSVKTSLILVQSFGEIANNALAEVSRHSRAAALGNFGDKTDHAGQSARIISCAPALPGQGTSGQGRIWNKSDRFAGLHFGKLLTDLDQTVRIHQR